MGFLFLELKFGDRDFLLCDDAKFTGSGMEICGGSIKWGWFVYWVFKSVVRPKGMGNRDIYKFGIHIWARLKLWARKVGKTLGLGLLGKSYNYKQ